ncbi:MAG: hypothetical protein ACYDIA_00285 [Candidatus Humimicrobiaceae bacterium]
MHKDFSRTGPFWYEISMSGGNERLGEDGWDYETTFIDNIFPITFYHKKT